MQRVGHDKGSRLSEMSQGVTITFVLNSLTMGGAEAQLAALVAARPDYARAAKLHIVTMLPNNSPVIEERFRAEGVTWTLIDRTALSFPRFFWRLYRTIRHTRPQIVHTLLRGSTSTWGCLAARLAGVPYVFHSDLSLDPEAHMTRLQKVLQPVVDRMTTRFLPNAEAIAEKHLRSGVPAHKVLVVPNGVDLSRFAPDKAVSARTQWNIPDSAVVAGFLGMFRPEKRPGLLFDALLTLPESERPDYVVMAGDGPLMPELRQRVADHPWLQQRCRLLGVVEDTPAFLAGIDYLVLCSDTEGLPNAVLEAMAMNKPVVATSVSDVHKLIEGVGFLAEPGDAASLAAALGKMQQLTPEARYAMGEVGRARALERYEMKRAAQLFWDAHLDIALTV